MAVEKMSLISISGPIKKVNKTLVKCCESKCFHIESSYYSIAYSSAHFKTLKDKNIYGHLIKRAINLAEGLEIKGKFLNYDDLEYEAIHDFDAYFQTIENEVGDLISEKSFLTNSVVQYKQVLRQIENLSGIEANFQDIFACEYVKVRFGRMPSDSYLKLQYYDEKNFVFVPFEENEGYLWGVYFSPLSSSQQIDDIFTSLYFERIRIPDYVSGTSEEAKKSITEQIEKMEEQLATTGKRLDEIRQREKTKFLKAFSKLRFLNDSYEMRKQVSVINNKFYMVGFVPTREAEEFTKKITEIDDVHATEKPYFIDERVKPPTKLRNNWLFRPFEMFVKMYGLPSYNGIDPTPYVAITFMLIYGIMFGDLGQGLVISLLGFILTKWKNVKLGPIMTRIGISSAVFGTLYGSVFGNETLITPFFHIEPLYSIMGKPTNIFQISTYLLIAALVIGVILIVISMSLNIALSLKRRDYESAFFGANGVTGLILYVSVVAGAGLQLGFGLEMFTLPYVLGLIILPLAIMFFKEPLAHWVANSTKKTVLSKKKESFADIVMRYSAEEIAAKDELDRLSKQLDDMMAMKYVRTRYGKMPADSYEKLSLYENKNFVFIPLESDNESITGIYFVPKQEKVMVDDIFNSLYFVREKMPAKLLGKGTEGKAVKKAVSKSDGKEKKSIGNFIIENIIELFETSLSYLTNTMSFLRVGGFILSHAGMMLVVGVLAGDGGFGSIIVMILGNAFVIGMEGFIVGIQVLRLEFYEIFGRFYKSDGKDFAPLAVEFQS